MKIQITIPDSAIDEVKEYCRMEGIDLRGRMQGELDAFVKNILWYMEQRKQINTDLDSLVKTFREVVDADRS